MKILVVDDSADVRAMLKLAIEAEDGWQVVGEAVDGSDAVEAAYQLQPDVVVLDLEMPRMDGLEALPLLKKVASDARVLVYSSAAAREVEGAAFKAGAEAFLEKKEPITTVLAEIKRLEVPSVEYTE